ncbi:hypothetical protein AB0N81_18885 [Streptomyces sp. NPDC093510]|uniref:hypothetical protein n=1 Tax=Streptomyces sp. NPDC093510 TaxID=3155199 RepID=UPI0034240E59
MVAAALVAVAGGPATTARADQSSTVLAGAGAGILPWLAVAAVAALGIGAVAYALSRRHPD